MAEKDEEQPQQAAPKKSPMLLIIIGAVALVMIVLLVAILLVFSGGNQQQSPGGGGTLPRMAPGVAPGVEGNLGPIADLKDQFIVNLLGNDGRRYLKVRISVELSNKSVGEEFTNKTPKIRDVIIQQLSSKRFDEISTETGKTRLREELKNNINRYLIDGQVKDIFFTDFVIQ
ncbi:MAG: flagellar basal body-associated FliL family protein [Helicobacteraceae bacterium]|jgi:flagellar FliL protein|nr:flagellar basal body-associated FliL family protein [Helicobacteraceae bacterium]